MKTKYCKNCSNDSNGKEKVERCRWCKASYCEGCMKDHLRYHDSANPHGVSHEGIEVK